METIFLDANIVMDMLVLRDTTKFTSYSECSLSISVLSVHIATYIEKTKMPSRALEEFIMQFNIVPLDTDIFNRSLLGPTADFEDNVQLNSALITRCSKFITNDKKLLKLGVCGLMPISSKL